MADIMDHPPSQQPPEDGEGKKKKRVRPDLPIIPIRNTADYMRMKLEKLMANPEKPVIIPESTKPKGKGLPPPPEFVRNVMGSSAGAGSGEFHVYRHIRRKEYARQKGIQEKSRVEILDEEFQKKIEDNKKQAEEKTAKKRAKRMRQKEQQKRKKKEGKKSDNDSNNSSDEEEDKNRNGNGKANGKANGNKPKLVVPTYATVFARPEPPPDVNDSSDSD